MEYPGVYKNHFLVTSLKIQRNWRIIYSRMLNTTIIHILFFNLIIINIVLHNLFCFRWKDIKRFNTSVYASEANSDPKKFWYTYLLVIMISQ